MNEILFELDNSEKPQKKGGAGPPNRMNDLPYKEWMKFQKSFFRFENIENIIVESCYFFTKKVWDNGKDSKILILSTNNPINFEIDRDISYQWELNSVNEIVSVLKKNKTDKKVYDFILIDLSKCGTSSPLLNELRSSCDELSSLMRDILVKDRYCSILLNQSKSGYDAWKLSDTFRKNLKLRDEKIGIKNSYDELIYCLFFQAGDDERVSGDTDNLITDDVTGVDFPTWTIPKPPPRKKNEILHPAKFPETLIEQFIKIFTKEGDNVLDPMAGTGSTVLASIQTNRNGYGIELMEEFSLIASRRVSAVSSNQTLFENESKGKGLIIHGNAKEINDLKELKNVAFNYCITSPPYWSMLTNPGSENQKKRKDKNLKLTYSDDNPDDLGTVSNYDDFLKSLVTIYNDLSKKIVKHGVLTVIIKNIKREHTVYHFAWDLTKELCKESGHYAFIGNTMWCQDDVGLKPFAVGIHWVSNTLHQYCLHFMKVKD